MAALLISQPTTKADPDDQKCVSIQSSTTCHSTDIPIQHSLSGVERNVGLVSIETSHVMENVNSTKMNTSHTYRRKLKVLTISHELDNLKSENHEDINQQKGSKASYQDVYTAWSELNTSDRMQLQISPSIDDAVDDSNSNVNVGMLLESRKVQTQTNVVGNKSSELDESNSAVCMRPGATDTVDNSWVDSHWVRKKLIYNCNICNKIYDRLDKVRDHIRVHLGVRPYACRKGDCKKTFTTLYLLNDHVKKIHNLRQFTCLKCDKTFCRASYLKQHENFHNNIKPYKCNKCGKLFHTNLELSVHKRVNHTKPKNKKQCEICGLVGGEDRIRRHIISVHLKKRHQCKVCNQNFSRANQLKEHNRIHSGEDLLTCDTCSKTFTRRTGLIQHVRKHLSPSFHCPKCDKVFKVKSFLVGHLRQHEGIKKYYCKICGKRFTHSHYLFTHMKSHGEKQFRCDICGGKFNRKDNLKSHILRHETSGRKNFKKK